MSQNLEGKTPAIRTLSQRELDAVTGGNIMDIVLRAALPALTSECLYQLTRQGTVVYCPNGLK